jgi:hypothetical protein
MTYSRMLAFQVEFLRYNMWYSKEKAGPKRPCLFKKIQVIHIHILNQKVLIT